MRLAVLSDAQVGRERRPDLAPRAFDGHARILDQRAQAVAVDQREQPVDDAVQAPATNSPAAIPASISRANHSCMRA